MQVLSNLGFVVFFAFSTTINADSITKLTCICSGGNGNLPTYGYLYKYIYSSVCTGSTYEALKSCYGSEGVGASTVCSSTSKPNTCRPEPYTCNQVTPWVGNICSGGFDDTTFCYSPQLFQANGYHFNSSVYHLLPASHVVVGDASSACVASCRDLPGTDRGSMQVSQEHPPVWLASSGLPDL